MTAREMLTTIGRTGHLTSDKLEFAVTVQDVRKVFDRVDYLVQPAAGKGTAWVSAGRVTLN